GAGPCLRAESDPRGHSGLRRLTPGASAISKRRFSGAKRRQASKTGRGQNGTATTGDRVSAVALVKGYTQRWVLLYTRIRPVAEAFVQQHRADRLLRWRSCM